MADLATVTQIQSDNHVNYNDVFERLFDEDDAGEDLLIGLVAYGLYKTAKREWLLKFKEDNGRGPSADDCRMHSSTQTGAVLDGYISRAKAVVNSYAGAVIEANKASIVADARKGSFWGSVWASYVASFAFALSLIVMVLVLQHFGVPLPKLV